MKKCPFCAEEIQDAAIKCKHCGESLEVNEPERSDPLSTPLAPPRKSSRHPLLWICSIIGPIAFIVAAVDAFKGGNSTPGLMFIGAAVVFFFIAPLGWGIGDLIRRFAKPDMIFATSGVDIAKARLFWMIGPQMIGVGIAFAILYFPIQGRMDQQERHDSQAVSQQTAATSEPTPPAPSPAPPPPSESPSTDVQQPAQNSTPATPPATQVQETTQAAAVPSFDCSKASTNQERLICSNNELADADAKLTAIYKMTLSRSPDRDTLRREQNTWRKTERDACLDVPCMLSAYQKRMAELSR